MASILKLQSTDGIFDYPDSGDTSKGTTEQQYIEWEKNHHTVLESTIRVSLWQPSTAYAVGEVVSSPNMKTNTVARVTKAGTSSAAEPAWTAAGNSVSDGTATWLIVPRTLDFATDAELTAGTVSNKIVSPKTLKTIMDTRLSPKLNTADLTPNMLWNVLHSKGKNFKPSNVTNAGWTALGTFICYYDSKVLNNQPAQYGQLINICADNANEATQLWLDQASGKLAYRGGNSSIVMNNTAFTYVASATDLANAKSALESSISSVSAKAGVVAGNVSNADSWWVKLGGTIPLIIQGGKAASVGSGETRVTTVSYPVAFPSVCFMVTGSPESNSNDRYAYRTGHHIVWKSLTQFQYGIGQEQQSSYFDWVAIGY